MSEKSPHRCGGFIDERVCGRQLDDGTVGSVCGKPAVWRIHYEWMQEGEATACDEHIEEARTLTGIVRVYPVVSDEVWSRLYEFLGNRTSTVDGEAWKHEHLQRLVEDLIRGPLAEGLHDTEAAR